MILNLFEIVFFVYSLFAKENSWLRPWSTHDHEFWSTVLKDGNFYKTVMTCTLPGAHQSETEEGQLKYFISFEQLTMSHGLQNGKEGVCTCQMHGGPEFLQHLLCNIVAIS